MAEIRVFIVDDHTILREGIHRMMESQPDIEVIGEAATGEEALVQLPRLKPDVLILDLSLPGISGLEVTRQVHHLVPEMRIVVLTMHESRAYFFQALQAGVSGYVLKEGGLNDLVSAVRVAYQGDVYIYPSMARQLVADLVRQPLERRRLSSLENLTPRENEILQLVAEGKTNREIAETLHLGLSTIQTHCSNVMNKLGLRNRAELIRYGIQRGLLEDPQ